MDPLTASALITGGGQLLSGLGGVIIGDGGKKKFQKEQRGRVGELFGLIKNRLGQSAIDPQQYLAEYMRSIAPQLNQIAAGANARVGVDSGVFQSEVGGAAAQGAANFLLNSRMQADLQKRQDDNNLLGLMASLSTYNG